VVVIVTSNSKKIKAPEMAPLSKWEDEKGVDNANGEGVGLQPRPKRSDGLSIKFTFLALLALGMYLWRRSSITPIMVYHVSDEGTIMDFDDVRTQLPILLSSFQAVKSFLPCYLSSASAK
jgi:hypothetical protein